MSNNSLININLTDSLSSSPFSSFFSSIWGGMPPELISKIYFLIDIAKIILILVFIYWVVAVIVKLISIRQKYTLDKIAKNVEEINQKLSVIFDKKQRKDKEKSQSLEKSEKK